MPLTGCQSQQAAVHLTVKVPRTGHDVVFDESITQIDQVISRMANEFMRDYETPVTVNVEVFEQNQYDEAVVDCFDTDAAADVLYGDYFNISTYIHTGRVVPLDDAITDKVRNDVFEDLWDMSTVKDRVYMMPYLSRQNVFAYNKELFRQAGLERYIESGHIQSWSLSEWNLILDTLAANLPEAVYPMMMYAASSQGDTHIMTLLRAAGSSFFDEDGHFNLSTPEGVAGLRRIQQGVARGWFPPHSENLEIEDCSSLFQKGQLAIYMVNNASINRYGDTIGLVNFPGPDADGCATLFVSGFEVFDNGDAQKVQVAKDFIAYIYAHEELLSYAAGTLPASKRVSEQYGSQITGFDLFANNRGNVVDFTGNNPDARAIREVFYLHIHDLLMGTITPEEAAARLDADCNAIIDAGIAASKLHD
ncbi:ABC transporter substrate-binding protein [Adlercreutzia murintestinalis]|uniref:ABC transporter substrate-binding protein n=1 Tax=Adlercreutzia murintestinalis TaxID=2941325 RepID=UPI00203DD278|nr:extracellular solute-binding protein [Adlercreutzia murintestinalis]